MRSALVRGFGRNTCRSWGESNAWRSGVGAGIRGPGRCTALDGGLVRGCAAIAQPKQKGYVEQLLSRYREPPPPSPQITRLTSAAKLLADPDVASEVTAELPIGELVETFADLENDTEWVLVRAPLEDNIDIMSDKPLEYLDGWLHNPALELAEHQVGDKIAARVENLTHPVLEFMRVLPIWKGSPLPQLMLESVCEFHTGKIGGVVKAGRFLVQRPSGAIPERIATEVELLFVARQRKKRVFWSSVVGLAAASVFGTAWHTWKWSVDGRSTEQGRFAWANLVGYMTISVVFLTPLCLYPCYTFAISHVSTATSVCFINLLLYFDLFSE